MKHHYNSRYTCDNCDSWQEDCKDGEEGCPGWNEAAAKRIAELEQRVKELEGGR